ncbi:MAG: polyprenol monophosphomannose synthase [Solirubrobacterales bacterium]
MVQTGTLAAEPAPVETEGGVWLVVPTYNEAEGIAEIVTEARHHLPSPHRILIVDDDSPDGTGRIADELAAESAEVGVIHRTSKDGLGPAYVAGFHAALEAGAELVVQMDADFSHDPADLPRLLAAAENADLVLGSRYVDGGAIERWGRRRKAISRWGSRYARVVLGVEVHDLTAGFKCWRRETLEGIDLDGVSARGYAFQVEMTYRAIEAGFEVVEVPIVFHDRRVGDSKMTRSIVLEAAWRVPAMRFRRSSG